MTVLVTGATGNVGSQLMHELADRDVPARAFVRDPDKARRMLGSAGRSRCRHVRGRRISATCDERRRHRVPQHRRPSRARSTTRSRSSTRPSPRVSPFWSRCRCTARRSDSPVGIWRRHALAEDYLGTVAVTVHGARRDVLHDQPVRRRRPRTPGRTDVRAGGGCTHRDDGSRRCRRRGGGRPDRSAASRGTVRADRIRAGSGIRTSPDTHRDHRPPRRFRRHPGGCGARALRDAGLPDWYADDLVAMFGEFQRGDRRDAHRHGPAAHRPPQHGGEFSAARSRLRRPVRSVGAGCVRPAAAVRAADASVRWHRVCRHVVSGWRRSVRRGTRRPRGAGAPFLVRGCSTPVSTRPCTRRLVERSPRPTSADRSGRVVARKSASAVSADRLAGVGEHEGHDHSGLVARPGHPDADEADAAASGAPVVRPAARSSPRTRPARPGRDATSA